MPILNVQINQVGQAGVFPAIIYILTNDTLAEVSAIGYLNEITEKFRIPLTDSDMALVATKTSPSSSATQTAWLSVSYSNGNWSLVPNSNSPNGLLNVQQFIASGIYIPTPGMRNVLVQCVGAGGAGGGAPNIVTLPNGSAGGGGGSGSYSQSYISSAIVDSSQIITIGIGGLGVANGNGGSGTSTSFGSLVVGTGGTGGHQLGAGSVPSFTIGGAGGAEGFGDLTVSGNPGSFGLYLQTNSAISGAGASSTFGGGVLGVTSPHSNGTNALENTGAGGSGAVISGTTGAGNLAGGHGGSGFLIVFEYN